MIKKYNYNIKHKFDELISGEIKSIHINSSINKIGWYKFYKTNIEKVTFENGLIEISDSAFAGCSNLKELIFPDTLETIGPQAFFNCDSLINIKFNEGLKTIKGSAFEDCYNLTSLELPDSLKEIGNTAFKFCTNLESVIIGKSVVSIGSSAFSYTRLNQIKFNGTIAQWKKIYKGTYALGGFEGYVECSDGQTYVN